MPNKVKMFITMACLLFVVSMGATKGEEKKSAPELQGKAFVNDPELDKNAKMTFLDNGVIRVGVNLELGGAITFLSDSKTKENIINNCDWGRQVQMSFYSGPNPYAPDGKKPVKQWEGLGWNPIQSGDFFGHRSKVLKHTNDGKSIYVQCIPMHWPLNNVPGECTFESWIEIKDNTVHVKSRLNNARPDKTQYSGRGQELPAVYVNGPYFRAFTYDGMKPFTNDKLTLIPQNSVNQPIWSTVNATENWVALVDKNDVGLGVWSPNCYNFLAGFFGPPGQGGSLNMQTGYIAPSQIEILDHNIVYDYNYVLIYGKLADIRKYVGDHAEKNPMPDYKFEKDRQHWCLTNASDAGWPIKGELNVSLEQKDPSLTGPLCFWRAEDAPTLYIIAAFQTKQTTAEVFWKPFDKKDFAQENTASFKIIPDGKFHTYAVDLKSNPKYQGAMKQLRLDPVPAGEKGDFVKIKSITFKKPEQK